MEDETKTKSSDSLRKVLCETYALFTQTQGAHWNYVGFDFASMHVLLESQYTDLYEAVDLLAERLRALQQKAPQNLQEIIGYVNSASSKDSGLIEGLVSAHESISKLLEESIHAYDKAGDDVTHDMLTARKTFHDKALWMLRACLGQQKAFQNSKETNEERDKQNTVGYHDRQHASVYM